MSAVVRRVAATKAALVRLDVRRFARRRRELDRALLEGESLAVVVAVVDVHVGWRRRAKA